MNVKLKMKGKKLVSLLLCLCIAMSFLPRLALPYDRVEAGQLRATEPLSRPAAGTSRDEILEYYGNGAFGDTSLTFEERAADLVSRMTPAEKQDQLLAFWGQPRGAVPTLGIQANRWWKEALHGIGREGKATSFPSPLNMASMWNPDLMLKIGIAISNEGRYHSNAGHNASPGNSLTYWSPTINLHRDPRWGRNEESMGEDPYLAGVTATMFVSGMQGDERTAELDPYYDPKYLKTAATMKHFAANNSEGNRHGGETDIDDRVLREYYLNVFQQVAENTDVEGTMTAYNKVNRVPAPANTYLVDDLLRKTWGFNGHVVSDCGAVQDIVNGANGLWQYTKESPAQMSAARSIRAGTDMNCSFSNVYNSNTLAAIDSGYMTEDDMDRALLRAFTERMRTGEFDPPEENKYRTIPDVLEAEPHLELSKQSSLESLTLLKNEVPATPQSMDKKILPVDLDSVPDGGTIVMVGDFANYFELGDYSGSPENIVTIKDGMREYIDTYNSENPGRNLQFKHFNGNASTAGSGAEGYLRNINQFTFEYADKTSVSQEAANANTVVGMQREGSNLGYITDNSYATYATGLDIANLTRITVSSAAPSTSHNDVYIHFRARDNKGPVLATVKTNCTSDWQDYRTYSADVDGAKLAGIIEELGTTPTICMVVSSDSNPDPVYDETNMAADYNDALAAATEADLTIVFVGSGQQAAGLPSGYKLCAEEKDRANLKLPLLQDIMAREVCKTAKRSVVVMQSVGFHAVDEFIDETDGFIFTSYNGQYQGWALPRVIFGDYNPSARLPFTWYANESQMPNILDYSIRPVKDGDGFTNYGRTYQYFTGDVQWPFGFGLSYTDFEISNVQIDKTAAGVKDKVTVTFDVENKGSVPGAQTVQVYVSSPKAYTSSGDRDYSFPVKQLKGFKHVELEPNEKKTGLSVELDVNEFFFITTPDGAGTEGFENEFGRPLEAGRRVVYSGNYEIQVASSSDDSDIAEKKTLAVKGTANPDGSPEDGFKPWLKTATLSGSKIWAEPGAYVKSNLAVALSDETLFQNDERQLKPQINEVTGTPHEPITIQEMLNQLKDYGVECNVEFTSDNSRIAHVNAQTGDVRALRNGVTTIRARVTINGKTWENAASDEKLEASYPLAVNGAPLQHVESVSVNPDTLILETGKTGTLKETVLPENAAVKDVTWSTSNPNVATVKDGQVTAVTPGVATITATTIDGEKTASCIVTVKLSAADRAKGEEALKLIREIGTVTFTAESKRKIEAARKAYDSLTALQRTLISREQLQILTDAEAAYKRLEAGQGADRAAVDAVIRLINGIGNVSTSSKPKIDAARRAYDALSAEQKKLITAAQLNILKDAEARYMTLIAAPKAGDTFKSGKLWYKVKTAARGTTKKTAGTVAVQKVNKNKSIRGSLTIPLTVKSKGYYYKVVTIPGNAFNGAKKLKKVTIKDNVTSIGGSAFRGCTSLTSVYIGAGVTKIEKKAFENCKKLKNIRIKSKKLKAVKAKAFRNIHKNARIRVPGSKLKAYKKLLKYKGLGKSVKITK